MIMKDVVLEPQEILALYASEAQLERGHTVTLLHDYHDDLVTFCMIMMIILHDDGG